MSKSRKWRVLSLILVCLLFNFKCVNASNNIFSKDKYVVPEGKSILLSPEFKNPDKKFKWVSENPSVVSVDDKGVAYAKSRGTAIINISDKNENTTSKCVVEVEERDPFRIVYVSSNMVAANENFKINAITYKDVELVKFEVSTDRYSKTFECYTKSNYLDYYNWEQKLKLPSNGNYHIKAYAKIGKSWKTCKEANSDLLVLEKYNKKESSFGEKMASCECCEMIAAWEGACPRVYKDAAGNLTIGYGKRVYPYEIFYNGLSQAEMTGMLLRSLNNSWYTKTVNKFLTGNKIKFNQQQFDALLSFSYNLGCGWINSNSELAKIILDSSKKEKNSYCGIVNSSNGLWVRSEPSTASKKLTVLKCGEKVDILDTEKVNEKWYKIKTKHGTNGYCYGDYMDLIKVDKGVKNLKNIDREKFAKEFLAYHHAGGKCNKGLFKRRVEELNIFFRGQYKRLCNLKKSDINYPIPECAKKLF